MTALFKTELTWGIIFSAMMFAWTCLEFATGLHTTHKDLHPILTNLVLFPSVAIYLLALRNVRKTLGGYMTWLQAIRSGMVMTVIIAVLNPMQMYLFFTYVNPTFFTDFAQYAFETNQAPSVEKALEYFNISAYLKMGTFGALVMGLVTAAATGYFVKKDPPATAE